MASTHGSRLAVIALVIAAACFALLWGGRRYAQAEGATLAEQILCHINTVASHPPIPRFNVGECPPPPPPPPPPAATEDSLALCSDGIDNDGDSLVDLADASCADFKPKLAVVKTVINDNGGTASASSFPLYIGKKGESATTTVLSGATTTVAVGTWVVGEISNPAYAGAFGGDCSASGEVTLAVGDAKTCVITNDDIASEPDTPTSGGSTPTSGGGSISGGGTASGGGGSIGLFITSVATTSAPLAPAQPVFQGACDTYLTAFIRPGSKNDESQVRRLQAALRDFEGTTLAVNGVYDAATLAAVRAFQEKYASDILAPWGARASTGYVYLTTRKKINELYCRNTRRFDLSAQELATIAQTKAKALLAASSAAAPLSPTFLFGAQSPSEIRASSSGEGTATEQMAAAAAAGKRNLWRRVFDFFRIR